MRIICVDDEELIVESMERLLAKIEPDAEFCGFTEAEAAFSYLAQNSADIALLDIELGEYSGISLARKCKQLCPRINIIFVTAYSQYAIDALQMHASGYLMKPVRAEELQAELANLRHPLPIRTTHRVRIQTFGNFEVFVDNKPLIMPLAKCRECLAYLVDRKGALITMPELGAVLWEDRLYDKTVQNNTHRVVSDLMKVLQQKGVADIIIKTSREIAIDIEKVDCDYFRFLNGDVSHINLFCGEYMTNYSWAEFTLAVLAKAKTTC